MTGLIWKDLLVMRKTLKSYLLLMVVYAVLAYLDFFDYGFIITFVQMILAVLPISAFAYDELSKWDRYAMSLPLGRNRVVGARYLFVLLLSLFTVALGLAGIALLYLAQQAEPLEMFLTLMVSTAIGLFIPTILLPLSVRCHFHPNHRRDPVGQGRRAGYVHAEGHGPPDPHCPGGGSRPAARGRTGGAGGLLPHLLPRGGGEGVLRCGQPSSCFGPAVCGPSPGACWSSS